MVELRYTSDDIIDTIPISAVIDIKYAKIENIAPYSFSKGIVSTGNYAKSELNEAFREIRNQIYTDDLDDKSIIFNNVVYLAYKNGIGYAMYTMYTLKQIYQDYNDVSASFKKIHVGFK